MLHNKYVEKIIMTSEALKSILTPKASEYLDNEKYSEFFEEITKYLDYEKLYCDSGILENFEKAGIDFLSKIDTIPIGVFNGCDLTKIELPQDICSIEDFAFLRCEKLKQVKFSNSVKSIGKRAFSDCKNLTTINIPEYCVVKENAFQACKKLNNVTIGKDAILKPACFLDCPLYNVNFNGTTQECSSVFNLKGGLTYTASKHIIHIKCSDGIFDYNDWWRK